LRSLLGLVHLTQLDDLAGKLGPIELRPLFAQYQQETSE
jgi:hypothetical protein